MHNEALGGRLAAEVDFRGHGQLIAGVEASIGHRHREEGSLASVHVLHKRAQTRDQMRRCSCGTHVQ
jgi:hypothetical protein